MENLEINETRQFNALLADEVVMDWLMELEADESADAGRDEQQLRHA